MTEPHTVEIDADRYQELLDAERELAALWDAGVDNWEGYDYAREQMLEK